MNKRIKIILSILLGVILGLLANTLLFWGLGVLAVKIFAINYTWSLFRGFIVGLVVTIMRLNSDKFKDKVEELIEKYN